MKITEALKEAIGKYVPYMKCGNKILYWNYSCSKHQELWMVYKRKQLLIETENEDEAVRVLLEE